MKTTITLLVASLCINILFILSMFSSNSPIDLKASLLNDYRQLKQGVSCAVNPSLDTYSEHDISVFSPNEVITRINARHSTITIKREQHSTDTNDLDMEHPGQATDAYFLASRIDTFR